MSNWTPNNKNTSSFSVPNKNTDTWTNVQHSDIAGGGFDNQTFDNAFVGFDDQSTITSVWTQSNKETV